MKCIFSAMWLLFLAAPVLADDQLAFVDVLKGATAMTVLPNGYILIAKPDDAYICVLNIRSEYGEYKIRGQVDGGVTPRAWCGSVEGFKKVGEK